MEEHVKKPHTTAHPGKSIRVKLTDGRVFIDKFVDSTDRYVWFKVEGKIPVSRIDSFGLAKVSSSSCNEHVRRSGDPA